MKPTDEMVEALNELGWVRKVAPETTEKSPNVLGENTPA